MRKCECDGKNKSKEKTSKVFCCIDYALMHPVQLLIDRLMLWFDRENIIDFNTYLYIYIYITSRTKQYSQYEERQEKKWDFRCTIMMNACGCDDHPVFNQYCYTLLLAEQFYCRHGDWARRKKTAFLHYLSLSWAYRSGKRRWFNMRSSRTGDLAKIYIPKAYSKMHEINKN